MGNKKTKPQKKEPPKRFLLDLNQPFTRGSTVFSKFSCEVTLTSFLNTLPNLPAKFPSGIDH